MEKQQTIFSYTKKIVFLIFLAISLPLFPQKKSLRFQHYTIEQGLPQNMVDCILQDSKGFMWFGTWNGLCRFDGYTFKDYRQQHGENSAISDNFIYAICEDYNQNLWIGTNTGLYLYLYNEDRFVHFKHDSSLISRIGRVNAISTFQDSNIYVGGAIGLLKLKLDKNSDIIRYQLYTFGNYYNELSGRSINHLMFDHLKNLWISTNNGINLLKAGTREFIRIQNDPQNPNSIPPNSVRCTFEDSDGLIWIGTENGACRLNVNTNTFTNYFQDPFMPGSLVHNSIMGITEDISGKIIIGTLGGISIYKKDGSDEFFNYRQNPNSEYDLNNDFINCVYTDDWGNIWIGTERGGINKYNSSKTQFEYFEKEFGNENTLNNNTINSILEDEKYIWIGTAGGGLNRFSKNNGKFKYYVSSPNNTKSLVNNFITALFRDKDNILWVGTWGGGLHKLEHESSPREAFKIFRPENISNSLISDYVSSIIQDKSGNLWIGTLGGLDKFNPATETFVHINEEKTGSSITEVGCLQFDQYDDLWIGTRAGLFKISKDKTKDPHPLNFVVKQFRHDDERNLSLSGDYVISLFKDSYNNIWAGTYGFGLNRLISEENGGSFIHYNTNNGLPNNTIYTILEDLSGNLWLTTDNGLSYYNTKDKSFRNFFAADGLQNNQYYWSASFINKSGKLYFGGMNGLNTFYPDWITDVNVQTNIVITDFRIYNEPVKPGKKYAGVVAMKKSATTADKLTLSYKSKEFSFEFSALDYEQPNMNQYAYKLEGFDKDWIEVNSNRRYANYTNLKPGNDYTFMVKAKNSYGKWIEPPKTIQIEIIPPYWATWWFRITIVLIVISSVIFYNRYRVYALKAQKKKLEHQVRERTFEIEKQKHKLEEKNIELAQRQEMIEGQKHKLEIQNEQILKQRDKLIDLNKKVKLVNQLKLKFFTNISHEFKTPLTLILNPLEKLLKKEPDTKSENYKTLSIINRNAQRLLQLINQLMDFRKLEQGKMKLSVSKIDINEFLSNIVSSFTALAEQKNITLKFFPAENLTDAWIDCQKIENVLYNLLSNAFKYTREGGKIWLRLNQPSTKSSLVSTEENKKVIIEVGDTGCGISTENQLHIFERFYQVESETISSQLKGTGIGLSLAKDLVEIHKGKIKVQSELNKGTIFYVQIPYTSDSYQPESIKHAEYDPYSIQKQANNLANELLTNKKYSFSAKNKFKVIRERATLLIVEDNIDLREFLGQRLNEKYNILEAENGKTAFEVASLHNPDVIVSDIMMPVLDGLKFCSMIKTNLVTSHIPVILLTAKGSVENQIEGLETGADKYLSKPLNFDLLEAHISNLIESRKKLYETFLIKNKIESKTVATTSTDEKFMNRVLKVIEDNIENPEFNVNTLLKALNISRSLLHRKITSLTNQSTVEFINNIRLKKSVEMLKNEELNISEIAYAVGFNDPKYFSRIFRKQFGKSPSDYQKELLQTT